MENLPARSLFEVGKFWTQNALSEVLSLQIIPLLVRGAVFLLVVKFMVIAFYNMYFHPLCKYPGPAYAAVSGLPWHIISFKGDQPKWVNEQHEKYGKIVRVAPNRLSFIDPQAWKDIYGHRTGGRQENPKDPRFYGKQYNGEDTLITMESSVAHGRLRKVFSNAFSDKALKMQEPLIKKYVDQLIDTMRRSIKEDKDVNLDMVKLYNCTTFDIMADLTFGEPLGMLDKSKYTPWVEAVFANVKTGVMARILLHYPLIGTVVGWLIPKSMRDMERTHFQHSADRVDRRLAKGITKDKPDIWNLVLEKGQDQLSLGQMHAESSVFMVAGTETTATLLSGLTYYFLKNPDKMQKAIDEVRALSEDKLTLEQLPRLPYLNACFEEALRVYPPVPVGIPRVTPDGGSVICGEWLPGKTILTVPQWASYRSALNFKDANSFIPERWLQDSEYESDRKGMLQPFSLGPRNCLGKNLAYHEMRIIMAKVLWHFDLELCSQSDKWADQKVWNLWQKPELWCRARPIR